MLKRLEATEPHSCWNNAGENEIVFVLLARDAAAPVAIKAWVEERLRLGKNKWGDPQITEALQSANEMALFSFQRELQKDFDSASP